MASTETLESISPATTVEMYLDHRRDDARISTLRKQRSALRSFVDWTALVDIEDMNDLDGRRLMEFKTWRKRESDLNTVSLNGNLAILRRFLVFCERIEAVSDGLADKVPLPNVPRDEEVSDRVPTDEAVTSMREYYAKFEYASRRQTQLELITEIGLRLGAVRSIDLGDLDLESKVVHLRHRPEGADDYGTPLKNGADGERIVNLSTGLANTIQDYVDHNRHDVEDQYDRAPLFTSPEGRVTRATIRRDFYKLTRPCVYSGKCPVDRDIKTCEGTKDSKTKHCPLRYSTHPFRKWAIMHQLDAGVSMELLSDRVDVSVPILEKHYDHRSEERKSKQRLEELEATLPEYSDERRAGIQTDS